MFLRASQYSTERDRMRRKRHPKKVVTLLEHIAAHHNSLQLPLQLIACSATVGRSIRRGVFCSYTFVCMCMHDVYIYIYIYVCFGPFDVVCSWIYIFVCVFRMYTYTYMNMCLTRSYVSCHVTHSYVWQWRIFMRDMTYLCVRKEVFMCTTRLMYICEVTHSYVRHHAFMCATWLIHNCHMTHPCVRHASFVASLLDFATSLFRLWHDSLGFATAYCIFGVFDLVIQLTWTGIFSTERGKRDGENYIIDWVFSEFSERRHNNHKCNRLVR